MSLKGMRRDKQHIWNRAPLLDPSGRAVERLHNRESPFVEDLGCGYVCSTHHILSWVRGVSGTRSAWRHVSFVEQLIKKPRKSHASLKHWWLIVKLKSTTDGLLTVDSNRVEWAIQVGHEVAFQHLQVPHVEVIEVPFLFVLRSRIFHFNANLLKSS